MVAASDEMRLQQGTFEKKSGLASVRGRSLRRLNSDRCRGGFNLCLCSVRIDANLEIRALLANRTQYDAHTPPCQFQCSQFGPGNAVAKIRRCCLARLTDVRAAIRLRSDGLRKPNFMFAACW